MYLHLQANNSTKNPHSISAQMKNLTIQLMMKIIGLHVIIWISFYIYQY